MITNLELKNMSHTELCELRDRVEKLIKEDNVKPECVECGGWNQHNTGCVAVE